MLIRDVSLSLLYSIEFDVIAGRETQVTFWGSISISNIQ